MVMQEMDKPRDTFMLVRGQYDKRGDKVTPDVPAFLPPIPPGAPANRLGLARWLVDPSHPLTARVAVNRYWQMFFGTGFVKTAEDFGSQGELPSHPGIARLAGRRIREPSQVPQTAARSWDVKALVRLIVTSATYRQRLSSGRELLARTPRIGCWRAARACGCTAEFIRDQAWP